MSRGYLALGIGLGLWFGSWAAFWNPIALFVASYPFLLLGLGLIAWDDQLPRRTDRRDEILRLACEWVDLRRGILAGETPEMAEIAQKLMALTLPTSKASSPSPCSRGVL